MQSSEEKEREKENGKQEKDEYFRAFIAADIPDDLREIIKKIANPIKAEPRLAKTKCKWVKSENLHITLRFLGNITIEQRDALIHGIYESIKVIKPFIVRFTSLMAFPLQKPRILALDMEPIDKLVRLAELIDREVVRCGLPKEKHSFSPHLTLARIERMPTLTFSTSLPKMEFVLDKVVFYRSEPTAKGSLYLPQAEIGCG